MTERVLLSGAFNDRRYRFGFFERIATTLELDGLRVERFNSFGFEPASHPAAKLLERLVTLPGRLLGIDKERIRAVLPWTPEGRRERALLKTVRDFRPDTLIVIRGFPHRARTLQACRRLGVKRLVGWYVEGPLEPGLAEAESQLYDCYYCIHTEIQPSFRSRIGWLPSHGLDSQTFRRIDWPRAPQRRVVFVGTPTPRRLRFLEPLRALPLELWGPKWGKLDAFAAFHRGDFIWGAELNALYNDSAIVLNIASWDAHLSGTTQRVVEIPASGAFMLTDDAAEVRALFEPGREIDVFTTPEELRAQCERYLDDAPLRERIADQGHRRALQQADFSVAARVLIGRLPAPSAPRSDPRPAPS